MDSVPRQQFEIRIIVKVNNKPVVRDSIKPYRKDVTSKLKNSADISRHRKLLDKQKKGKSKMRDIGGISLDKECIQNI